jgi:hypothetical protein
MTPPCDTPKFYTLKLNEVRYRRWNLIKMRKFSLLWETRSYKFSLSLLAVTTMLLSSVGHALNGGLWRWQARYVIVVSFASRHISWRFSFVLWVHVWGGFKA